jgi:hypothetical protein
MALALSALVADDSTGAAGNLGSAIIRVVVVDVYLSFGQHSPEIRDDLLYCCTFIVAGDEFSNFQPSLIAIYSELI